MSKENTQTLQCSFCGKSQQEVRKLIAGPTVYICDECIGLCNDIIAEELDRGNDVRDALLIRADRYDHALGRLEELSGRLGEKMPVPIQGAIRAIRSASSELRSAVALSLPEVPRLSLPEVPPGQASVRIKDQWPLLSSVLEAVAALLSRPEDLPEELPKHEEVELRMAIFTLSDLVQFLGPHGGQKGPATPAPRD